MDRTTRPSKRGTRENHGLLPRGGELNRNVLSKYRVYPVAKAFSVQSISNLSVRSRGKQKRWLGKYKNDRLLFPTPRIFAAAKLNAA